MDAPRTACSGEFRELMGFIDRIFRPGQPGRSIMQGQYPHLFQNKPGFLHRYLLVRDQGEIVGHVAVHPLQVRLEDAVLEAGGIGQVAAHPEHRGEGIMSCLLEEAITRMRRKGYAISVLGGDRQRYGWFGWENGGVRNVFTLTPRLVGRPSSAERCLPLRRLEITPAVGRRILAVDRLRSYRVERRPGEMKPLFARRSREVWGCGEGKRFAYVVLGGGYRQTGTYERVDEAGGDAELVMAMIRLLMARYRLEQLTAIAGPNPADVNIFRKTSARWERRTDGMVKIVDLTALLDGLKPLLQKRAKVRRTGGTYRFSMVDSGQQGVLELGGGSRHVVELSDRDMVSLFFGALPVREVFPEVKAFTNLDRILPLPLHVPPLNHV